MSENTRAPETPHDRIVERWRDLLKQDLEPHVRRALERLIKEEEGQIEPGPLPDTTEAH
jgi:hypothetical protein